MEGGISGERGSRTGMPPSSRASREGAMCPMFEHGVLEMRRSIPNCIDNRPTRKDRRQLVTCPLGGARLQLVLSFREKRA